MSPPSTILLPDPCLVVLVGAAGSGKSTFAARHFSAQAVVSSDAFRELVSGDAADQAATGAAFAALHATLDRRLREGRLTVVDATSVLPRARRRLLRSAMAAGVPAVAIVLDLPGPLVLARNAARSSRVVPEAAVLRQLDAVERTARTGVLEAEGFSLVIRLSDPADVDAVRIVRTRRGAASGPGR